MLRVSTLNDRTLKDYLAETEFVHFLARNGAPVADVLPSVNGRYVERIGQDGGEVFVSLFEHADGMLLADNGYRYREGAPLEEYFCNIGKTLGAIHRLAKLYIPRNPRPDFRDRYSETYIDRLIPGKYTELKGAIFRRYERFGYLPVDKSVFGPVHFDFSDGNYHVDMKTGRITVFDFDNCVNCWYMYDLANLWTHGEGWCRHIRDAAKREAYMKHYFGTILEGYRSETEVSDSMLSQLPLFVDMVMIENIVDEFECCARNGKLPEDEDIQQAAEWIMK